MNLTDFQKPRVVVSKCIEFDSCRYNGLKIPDAFVAKLMDYVDFHPVCPEVGIGLGVPRSPVRVISVDGRKILQQPSTGKEFTGEMENFVENFLSSLRGVDGFILKNRSPSCGFVDVKVYASRDDITGFSRGSGFFGGAVLEKFKGMAIEDEGRLNNFAIREHFLTKLYAHAFFRMVKESNEINKLIEFHAKNKLLMLGYNEKHMRIMGQITANPGKHDTKTVIGDYEKHLTEVFSNVPGCCSMINSILHAFGWISENLSKKEKEFFLNSVEEYRDERIPLSTLIHLLKSWAIRFGNEYLLSQSFLEPYPKALTEMDTQGRKRHYDVSG